MESTKNPSYIFQYYEFSKKVDQSVELLKSPLKIDGFFEPYDSSRLSLGYLENLKRDQESLECLIGLKNGIEFYKNDQDYYVCKSKCDIPVYIMLKCSNSEQILLQPDNTQVLFSLKPLIEHKILPKKVAKAYEEFTIKVSFLKPFEFDQYHQIHAASWIEMKLNKIVD